MRALVISAVVGALALSGCQNMEYDKAAIGTGIGALLGAGLAYSNADKDKMGQAAAIGAVVGGGAGFPRCGKKFSTVRKKVFQGVEKPEFRAEGGAVKI